MKYKSIKTILFSLLICLLSMPFGGVWAYTLPDALYQNKEYGFQFDYSQDFAVIEWDPVYNILSSVSVGSKGSLSKVTVTVLENNSGSFTDWISSSLDHKDSKGDIWVGPSVDSNKHILKAGDTIYIENTTFLGLKKVSVYTKLSENVLSVSLLIDPQPSNNSLKDEFYKIVSSLETLQGDPLFRGEDLKSFVGDEMVTQRDESSKSFLTQTQLLLNDSYKLPWVDGVSWVVTQGWNSSLSHVGTSQYAYDFGLPENTEVRASRSGTVAYMQGSYTACGGPDLIDKANYVVINHDDNSATAYYHLNSTSVSVNQGVVQGQMVGLSGKTGYTNPDGTGCGPHLHFQRQAQGGTYTQSQSIYFEEYPGIQLSAWNSYTSQNYGVSTACGVNDVILINRNLYHNSFSCNALNSIRLLNSDINDSYVVLTVNNGGIIYLDPGTDIHDMNSEASFTARVNP